MADIFWKLRSSDCLPIFVYKNSKTQKHKNSLCQSLFLIKLQAFKYHDVLTEAATGGVL